MPSRLACVLAAALLLPATLAAASAPQDRSRRIDGNSVGVVRHSGGGSFEEGRAGRWTEFGANGEPIHEFEEERRNAFGLVLLDQRRGTRVWIDLRAREIRVGPVESRARPFYRITDVDARRRGWDARRDRDDRWDRDERRGRNDRWDRDEIRNVEVGPIWNQADAEAKCRARARETRGEWTGHWHTTVPGRMSVCQIRYR